MKCSGWCTTEYCTVWPSSVSGLNRVCKKVLFIKPLLSLNNVKVELFYTYYFLLKCNSNISMVVIWHFDSLHRALRKVGESKARSSHLRPSQAKRRQGSSSPAG